ncbi:MAG TPA: ABC transporter substrate-binding protein, partial [Solirubrobacteraceae bacterium]|nr:ABC transporter substrate-binding protein [Solirubrobacteraceae bacterium]
MPSKRVRGLVAGATSAAVVAGAVIAIASSSGSPAARSAGAAQSAPAAQAASASMAGLYGSLPSAGTPASGGTITMGQISGSTPTYIFPIIPGADATDGTEFLTDQLWLPLYNLQVGGSMQVNYATSAALPPTFSDNDRRVTIKLRPGLDWSNGKPVTADDVLFDIALLKAAVKESPANYGDYTPGLFPDNTTIATPNASTFVVNFSKSYNQNFDLFAQLDVLQPLPAHAWAKTSLTGPIVPFDNMASATAIYNFLVAQAKDPKTYGTNPLWQVVDGPYK